LFDCGQGEKKRNGPRKNAVYEGESLKKRKDPGGPPREKKRRLPVNFPRKASHLKNLAYEKPSKKLAMKTLKKLSYEREKGGESRKAAKNT